MTDAKAQFTFELMPITPRSVVELSDDEVATMRERLNDCTRTLVAQAFAVPTELLEVDEPIRSSGDIVRDIIHVAQWLDEHPVAQAIWFIDRERGHWQFEEQFRGLSVYRKYPESPSLVSFRAYRGMPLHRWRSGEIREHIAALVDRTKSIEYARSIYPFCQPGVWVQMSDGKHRRLAI